MPISRLNEETKGARPQAVGVPNQIESVLGEGQARIFCFDRKGAKRHENTA